MDLFKFLDVLCSKTNEYDSIKPYDKSKHFFIVNRFMSIKYPTYAQSFNRNGINGVAVLDMWRLVMKKEGKKPYWMYTKTKKTEKDIKSWYPEKEIKLFYMKRNNLSEQDFNNLLKFNPKDVKEFLTKIEKQLKGNE